MCLCTDAYREECGVTQTEWNSDDEEDEEESRAQSRLRQFVDARLGRLNVTLLMIACKSKMRELSLLLINRGTLPPSPTLPLPLPLSLCLSLFLSLPLSLSLSLPFFPSLSLSPSNSLSLPLSDVISRQCGRECGG
jgi:hypothetical protein